MPRLYLIRHGQTDFNLRGIVQGGGIDSDLNSTGRAQGRRFYESYQSIEFDKVYCSSLKRTRQTIQDFQKAGYKIEQKKGLDELSWGVIEGKERSIEIGEEFDRVLNLWNAGRLDAKMEGGESPEEVWLRAKESLNQIVAEVGTGGKALICTHGRTLRIILSQLMGYGMHQMRLFPHHNTTLNVLVRQPNGRWLAERLNDLSHLQ